MPRKPDRFYAKKPVATAVYQSREETERVNALARSRQAKRAMPTNSRAWRWLRSYVLSRDPLCVMCKGDGRIVVATEVDHIDGDATRNTLDNLQGLCRSHHSRKTATENGGFGNSRKE